MNVGIRGQDRAHDLTAGDNHAGGDERVDRVTQTILVAIDELGGRQRAIDHRHRRPLTVVQVEHRVHRDKVHVRLVVGVQRTNVAPVIAVAVGRTRHVVVLEVVDAALTALDEPRDDVATHVVLRIGVSSVLAQSVDQVLRGEDVVAHRRQDLGGIVRQALCVLRLLQEVLHDAALAVDDTQGGGELDRLTDTGDRGRQARLDVVVDHLREVHAVDVVRTDDDDVLGRLVVDDVERLVDRVRAAQVPVRPATLLSRNRRNEVAEQGRSVPSLRHVAVKRVRLVLGQHDDLEVSGVHDIRQSEIDQTEMTSKRNGRLRAIRRQRHQTLTFTARKNNR